VCIQNIWLVCIGFEADYLSVMTDKWYIKYVLYYYIFSKNINIYYSFFLTIIVLG